MRRLLALLLLILAIARVQAEPAILPQPALLPPASPLCDASLVPCLAIDDLAAHAYAHLIVLPKTALRSTAISIPYGLSLGLFRRVSVGVSSHTSFWSQAGSDWRSQGPVRLSAAVLLWPLHAPEGTPSTLRIGVAYDHELRAGPFDGPNSLGVIGSLGSVRVVGVKTLGLFAVTLSIGALLDPARQYALGEAAAQLGFQLPFLRSLKVSVDGVLRGAPAYVSRDLPTTAGEYELPPQGVLGAGISYQPHARVDFGAAVQRGFGGLAPWSILFRFVTLSVGKTYEGQAATPLTELGAELAARAAERLKESIEDLLQETFEASPIDPKLDDSCFIRDDDGSIMGRFGTRTPDGRFCEKDGAKIPIGRELWRDQSGDRLCNDSRHNPRTQQRELYDCVLWKGNREWNPAHQARLNERCELRDQDGRLLGQLGSATGEGQRCRYPVQRDNGRYGKYTDYQEQPRDRIFYTDAERSRVCETPNLKRCFVAAAEGRDSLKMEPEERFARGADRAVEGRQQHLRQSGEAIEDLATGRVSLTTLKDEVTAKTTKLSETVTDRDKLRQYAKEKVSGWLQGIEKWSRKRGDDQLDDAGGFAADAVMDGAVTLGIGAAGKSLGGVVSEAEQIGKAGAKRLEREVAEHIDEAAARRALAHEPKRPPGTLAAFPDAQEVPRKRAVQGGGGRRKRWKDVDGRIYEWDSRHGTVELYSKNGRHLGEFDHETGRQIKSADPTRTTER
jgi:hypothetical protein